MSDRHASEYRYLGEASSSEQRTVASAPPHADWPPRSTCSATPPTGSTHCGCCGRSKSSTASPVSRQSQVPVRPAPANEHMRIGDEPLTGLVNSTPLSSSTCCWLISTAHSIADCSRLLDECVTVNSASAGRDCSSCSPGGVHRRPSHEWHDIDSHGVQ